MRIAMLLMVWLSIPLLAQEVVDVPAGEYYTGPRDNPARFVRVPAYRYSRNPVTNAEYARFVARSGYFSGDSRWQRYALERGPGAPVVCVSWDDATAWCRWAGVRLPSWAQCDWATECLGIECQDWQWVNDWYGSSWDFNGLDWFNRTPSAFNWIVHDPREGWFKNPERLRYALVYAYAFPSRGGGSICFPEACGTHGSSLGFRYVTDGRVEPAR